MYAIPGLIGLIIFTYVRPQEFVPGMGGLPWINMWLALILGGFIYDMTSGQLRKEKTPLLKWSLIFYVWCFFTLALKVPGEMAGKFTYLTTGIGLSLIIQHAIQSAKTFLRIALVVFATSMFCVSVAFHQGFQDFQCVVVTLDPENPDAPPDLAPDGRPCERQDNCREGPGGDEELDYYCEHVGLFGTTSISTGRVRWRGVLMDPNETTLAAGQSIPFALAVYEMRRTLLRLLLVLATVVVVVITDVFSQSRGAILIFMTVMGVYFVRKYGIRGALVGGGMAAPLMMLGGRSGEEAAQSAEERMEVMHDGLNMFFGNPIFGVGYAQFTKHCFLTAHNAYVLAASELGLFGFFVWMVIVYTVMKMMILALQRYKNVPGGEMIRAWALALFASFCGTLVGIFFLSWTYHYVLWIYFGIAGGFYTMIRTTDRNFEVKISRGEYGLIIGICIGLMVGLRLWLRLKGH
ncbi:MAG: O-antigen ligase family protein [Polyangiaceae bacterium]|nr:O-antigen ligase family protein [Polyangiaceae bacterium]